MQVNMFEKSWLTKTCLDKEDENADLRESLLIGSLFVMICVDSRFLVRVSCSYAE